MKLREAVLWKENSEKVSSLVHGGSGVTFRGLPLAWGWLSTWTTLLDLSRLPLPPGRFEG